MSRESRLLDEEGSEVGASTSTAPSLSSALGFPRTVVEFGMTHPGVRRSMTAAGGTASFLVDLDDDRICDLEVEIGMGHRGFEKEVESVPWSDAFPYVARLGLASGLIAQTGYALAVESLQGRTLPDRAIWIRMLVSELARVTDHWARLSAVMASLGLREAEVTAQRAEIISKTLLEAAISGGMLTSWVVLGGVSHPLPADFAERWRRESAALDALQDRFERVGVENPTTRRRLQGIARLSAEDALAWGVTGVALRAAGMPADIRRDRPYLAYGALDFDVPIGEHGDAYDRLLIVHEEIRQSRSMISQCLELLTSLGPGPIAEAEPSSVAAGQVVSEVESSTGALGFFVVSDGEDRPRRVRCRAPSFFHAQAMPLMMRGARLDDLLPTAALLHLVAAECDR